MPGATGDSSRKDGPTSPSADLATVEKVRGAQFQGLPPIGQDDAQVAFELSGIQSPVLRPLRWTWKLIGTDRYHRLFDAQRLDDGLPEFIPGGRAPGTQVINPGGPFAAQPGREYRGGRLADGAAPVGDAVLVIDDTQLLQLARKASDREKKVDRKSTRLNSSHGYISYAVFC